MTVRPYVYIDTESGWRDCVARLREQPRMALDVEANSLYVYREYLCLLQISIPEADYIIDPLAGFELTGLADLLLDERVEKVFHASEYDLILLKRQFDWDVVRVFDTMWAARILGYQNMGLAWFLEKHFDVVLSKKHQKANWGLRPLTESQLEYAQKDTHYLLELRDKLERELVEAGRLEEAEEIFAQIAQVRVPERSFSAHSFWSISGAHDLPPRGRAVLQALDHLRDSEAKRRNLPPFKIISNSVLLDIARKRPKDRESLEAIAGISRPLLDRQGDAILRAVARGSKSELPKPLLRPARMTVDGRDRLDLLMDWRKRVAQERGVQSDVVMHRDTLFEIAQLNPGSLEEMEGIPGLGPARLQLYGESLLQTLQASQSASEARE